MKKKIIAVAAMSMLFAGVVHASSLNGDYNGNPIVNVTANGKAITVEDAPAMVYNDRTMVPIYMLKQLGASVTWDQNTYSVDVSIPSTSSEMSASVDNLAKLLGKSGNNLVKTVSYTSYGSNPTFIEFQTNFVITDSNNSTQYNTVLYNASKSDATTIQLSDPVGNVMFVATQDARDFYNSKITDADFQKKITLQNINQTSSVNSNPTDNQNSSTTGYTLNDALVELGVTGGAIPTVEMKDLAIQLMEIRKTKSQSDYSVQDALRDLGIPQGSIPTLTSLKQAVKLIEIH